MRKRYDISKASPNPYAKRLKRSVTIRMDEPTLAHFRALADEFGIPYQTLINLYLRDCVATRKKSAIEWCPVA